ARHLCQQREQLDDPSLDERGVSTPGRESMYVLTGALTRPAPLVVHTAALNAWHTERRRTPGPLPRSPFQQTDGWEERPARCRDPIGAGRPRNEACSGSSRHPEC